MAVLKYGLKTISLAYVFTDNERYYKMTDYKNIDTSDPKLSFAGMVCEGLAFVLAFLGLLVLITLLSAL